MATALVIIHGLVAVALLGAITHQTLATWAPAGSRPGSFFGRFRAVRSAAFTNAIVVLYTVSALLGGIVYLYFRVDVRPELERDGIGRRLAASTSRSISSPSASDCCRLTGFAGGNRSRTNWLRVMTFSSSFRRFAFAYGTAFAVFYVVALAQDLALFTVFPSFGVVLLGTHHYRDFGDPALGFLAPAIYWYGWTATAATGALMPGLIASFLPGQWTRDGSGWDGCGWFPWLRWLRVFTSQRLGLDFSQARSGGAPFPGIPDERNVQRDKTLLTYCY